VRVYEKIERFAPPPPGVTREGVLKLDQKMLDQWREALGWVPGGTKGLPKGKGPPDWKSLKYGDPKLKDAGSR